VAAIGLYGSKPAFWPLPSTFLSGTAAAGGIALVNSIGNLGGFAGPYVVGWIRTSTQSYEMGLFFLAGCALLSGAIALLTVKPVGPEPAPRVGEAPAFSRSSA
jgi:ACS family tartrate transporter-like MFS transporter